MEKNGSKVSHLPSFTGPRGLTSYPLYDQPDYKISVFFDEFPNYLKMSINRLIGVVVKILESDMKAVIFFSGELVDFFQAQPQFTW